jgi:hypothetical protein
MYGTIIFRFLTSVSVLVFIPFWHKSLFYAKKVEKTLRKSRVSGPENGIGCEKGLKWFFSKVGVKACQELTTLAVFQTHFVQVHHTFRKK